jgi:hypothetical protein
MDTPDTSPVDAAAPSAGWRRRHPVAARLVLYATFAALAATALLLLAKRRKVDEADRQAALIAKLDGMDQTGLLGLAPDQVLKQVREDVLPKANEPDVVRRAHLMEAAALDALKQYDESEKVYAAVDAALPAGTPKGPVRVPWANMRISAGRAKQALELLDQPGSTEGWPTDGPQSVQAVRARAQKSASDPGMPGR